MPRFLFNVNDIVRSGYQAPWIGVVVDREARAGMNPLYTVRAVLDRSRRPISKHERGLLRDLDEAYLRPYTPRDAQEEALIRLWSDPSTSRSSLEGMITRVAAHHLWAVSDPASG